MENINFIQTNNLFSLNALTCLRNEYLFNDCQLCFERCEQKALGVYKNKIKLFEELCTSCGGCIGVCPTQSLHLASFDVIHFIFSFLKKEANTIVEKIDIPHFGIFDAPTLISLILRAKHTIFLEYHPMTSLHDLDYIEKQVHLSNHFLSTIGVEYSLFLKPHQTPIENTTRRALFKNLMHANQEIQQQNTMSQKLVEHQKTLPAKMVLFKNSLKLVCEDITNTHISTSHFPLFNQKIEFERCTNCVECITFCPTNALFQSSSKESIFFQSGKCIGCNICHDVCQPHAIKEKEEIDLIEFMFDKAEKLVEFEYIKCEQCNNAFIHKNQGTLCEICQDYTQNYHDMFTLAKDL